MVAPAQGGHFSAFLKVLLIGLSPPLPPRRFELHPHPLPPLAAGNDRLDELNPDSLRVFIYSGQFCSSLSRGFPDGSCLFLGKERPRQGIGMSQSCFPMSPKW